MAVKKVVAFALTSCLALCLSACGGVNLDRTIVLGDGVSIKVSSGWEKEDVSEAVQEYSDMALAYNLGGEQRITVNYRSEDSSPYNLFELVEEASGDENYSNYEILSQEETTVDGAIIMVCEYSYVHVTGGEMVHKEATVDRGGARIAIGYIATKSEYNSEFFDAMIKSISWG